MSPCRNWAPCKKSTHNSAHRHLGLDVAKILGLADAGGQKAVAGNARVVELCTTVFAANFKSSSHSCKVFFQCCFVLFTLQSNRLFLSGCVKIKSVEFFWTFFAATLFVCSNCGAGFNIKSAPSDERERIGS